VVAERMCHRVTFALVLPAAVIGAVAGWTRHPGVVAAVALGVVLLAIRVVRSAGVTTRAATEAAQQMATGSFAVTIPLAGSREERELATALNTLAAASVRRDDQLNSALEDAATQRDLFYSIINASSDGLLLYDNDRHLVATNLRCGELLGFSVHDLLTNHVGALQHSMEQRCEQPELYKDRLERHFARSDQPHQDILVLREPRRRVLRRYSCPVTNQRGVQGRVFTYTDVTAESDIDRMKSEFVSTASHELRTPLTSVHGALQLALSGTASRLADEDRELLEISLANTERLVRLVNDLLDLSKIEAGRMPFVVRPFDILALLEEAARGIQGLAATRETRIVTEHDGQAELGVRGDRDQLLRVVTNLLSNAVKYSPAGTGVLLGARRVAEGVEVSVQDQGQGIPADHVDRLFRPFSRVGAQERQTTGGTGLGLAISRAIVEQHGGRIWVERAWPRGSRFVFVLPVRAPDDAPVETDQAA
jgi:signal transduction histidine kinase